MSAPLEQLMTIRAPTGSGTSYIISTPVFGYSIDYVMSTKITKAINNQYTIWDNGYVYDHSILNCTWLLNSTDATTLINIFKDTNKARGGVLDFILPSNSGFYPLGASEHDSGTFTFIVMEYDQQAIIGHPEDYFYVNAKLHETNTIHDYNSIAQSNLGNLQIGTITGLRWPDNYHTPDYKINFVSQITEHDYYFQIDRTSGDQYEAELPLTLYTGDMGALINHLTTVVRGNAVNIITPDNAYMFGKENGSGTHSCKLIQNVITQKHILYNRWTTSLKFSKVI
jgi:hypothetical protein